MPLDKTIGSQGLEQGGANLGNDYSRPSTHVEQNETTNVGSHGKVKDESDKKKKPADGYSPDEVEESKQQGSE